MNYENLKIQFRAVPYASDNHVLEWRINPEQDITYIKEIKILGLFRINIKHKYNTDWHKLKRFFNHSTSYLYAEDDSINWFPFWIENQKDLDWYKNNFNTVGEFIKYQQEISDKDKNEWITARINYLERNKILY